MSADVASRDVIEMMMITQYFGALPLPLCHTGIPFLVFSHHLLCHACDLLTIRDGYYSERSQRYES